MRTRAGFLLLTVLSFAPAAHARPLDPSLWLRLRFQSVSQIVGDLDAEVSLSRDGLIVSQSRGSSALLLVRATASAAEVAKLRRALGDHRIGEQNGLCACCIGGGEEDASRLTITWTRPGGGIARFAVGSRIVAPTCSQETEDLVAAILAYLNRALEDPTARSTEMADEPLFP